jgi:hypothetical protein
MKFSQAISWVRQFSFLETVISKTISVLVLRVVELMNELGCLEGKEPGGQLDILLQVETASLLLLVSLAVRPPLPASHWLQEAHIYIYICTCPFSQCHSLHPEGGGS